MQVLSQTHWLTQLLDMEVRDGHVIKLRGSEVSPSCTSSSSTLSEKDTCNSSAGLSERENIDEPTTADPINVALGPGEIQMCVNTFSLNNQVAIFQVNHLLLLWHPFSKICIAQH